ncbi:MAG TPA: M20/M25/M40 family metallo-hydrolase [Gemmatimonadaceae bacterium]|jgi:acetylornithine deacetylase/succinyl-diaminopimelate desuccinylase-like protein|nr:M20/M25/M40 family metallo-hydrolase [Gemmatimonadaceae bacterium]
MPARAPGRSPDTNAQITQATPTTQVHHALAASRARLAAHDDAILRSQITVAQIGAPTGEETERGAWVARRFRDCGLQDIHTDRAGNVIGRRAGDADLAPVVICAHLDTVFPHGTDLSVRRDGERLVGPGINDNGRGLAVMLALASEIDGARLKPSRPVEFVATTGEEGIGDLRGAKHYFSDRGRDAHAMVALDGAGDERIIHRALGSRRFRIAYNGPGGHSWAAFGSPNAVHAAAAAASRLASLPLTTNPRTTLSVGRIGGGLSVNSIPDSAWLEIDLRSTSTLQLDDIERAIRRIAQAGADDENAKRSLGTRPLRMTIESIGARPCGETDADHALVQFAIEATRLIGREPELALASTDANVPISQGIPAIAIGAGGRGGDAHTHGEWYDNLHGTLGVARALTIVMAAAG